MTGKGSSLGVGGVSGPNDNPKPPLVRSKACLCFVRRLGEKVNDPDEGESVFPSQSSSASSLPPNPPLKLLPKRGLEPSDEDDSTGVMGEINAGLIRGDGLFRIPLKDVCELDRASPTGAGAMLSGTNRLGGVFLRASFAFRSSAAACSFATPPAHPSSRERSAVKSG
jgi:hypothetical protein